MSWITNILKFFSAKEKDFFYVAMEQMIDNEVNDISLYKLAFQHKSKNIENNERLEFLGDSILDAVVSEVIYAEFPKKSEGDLSKLRSKLVSRNMLNSLANKLGLLEHLSYRATHTQDGLQNSEGNALEALIGAIYLDLGYEACQHFIKKKLIKPHIYWEKLQNSIVDHKSLLYAYCQKDDKKISFQSIEEDLTNLKERFHIVLKVDGKLVAEAKGKSKKIAEQKAAKIYLEGIGEV